ncbi:MAG: 6-phosphofructokinase [Pirellulales bacterium]
MTSTIQRVAILFAGGAAPAANAVISAAATALMRSEVDVLGLRHGFSRLEGFDPQCPLRPDEDYFTLNPSNLRRCRNAQGVLLGTARSQPGGQVKCRADLADARLAMPLRRTYEALCSLDADALISIGGDGTLETACKLKIYQDQLGPEVRRVRVVHVPKTINNDYTGIDFAFGYFTAVDALAGEIRNLIYDAQAGSAYFFVETMGRSAGWLAYGASIAGEATLVIGVEDITGDWRSTERFGDPKTGEAGGRPVLDVEQVVNDIVELMRAREREGKAYGVIVLAEGLVTLLPLEMLGDAGRGDHDEIPMDEVHLARLFAEMVADRFEQATGHRRKTTGLQLGFEARCALPHAFDVLLGSQLGVGACRALTEEGADGVMVSVSGQLELRYVPFEELVDPDSLVTKTRSIDTNGDFFRLARFLETGASGHRRTPRETRGQGSPYGNDSGQLARTGADSHRPRPHADDPR